MEAKMLDLETRLKKAEDEILLHKDQLSKQEAFVSRNKCSIKSNSEVNGIGFKNLNKRWKI